MRLTEVRAIADMRFDFIERLCEQTVVKPKESKERVRSEKIDKNLDRKIYSDPMLYRNHGACILSDI